MQVSANVVKLVKTGSSQTIHWAYYLQVGTNGPQMLAQTTPIPVTNSPRKLPQTWNYLYKNKNDQIFSFEKIDSYHALVKAIVYQLECMETTLGDTDRADFEYSLSNGSLEDHDAFSKLFEGPKALKIRNIRGEDEVNSDVFDPLEKIALQLVLFKAVFIYLWRDERYVKLDAQLACLYSIWQWYNLAKYLAKAVYPNYLKVKNSKNASTSDITSHPYKFLTRELAEAHHHLVHILETPPDFDEAIKWVAYWAGIDPKITSAPMLRERMRSSLPLIPKQDKTSKRNLVEQNASNHYEGIGEQEIDVFSLKAAFFWKDPDKKESNWKILGWIRKTFKIENQTPIYQLDWKNLVLHPVFEIKKQDESTGRQAIRRLISDWLLPRYDFDSAVQFAQLLKKNQTGKHRFSYYGAMLWGAILFLLIFLISPLVNWIWISDITDLSIKCLRSIGIGIEWFLIVITVLLVRGKIDHSILPYFLLPRIAGGVMVGYLALILSEDSYRLFEFFIDEKEVYITVISIALLWASVLALGYAYLYFDALPFVGVSQRKLASHRAFQGLLATLTLAMFLGLLILAIASQMYLGDYFTSASLTILGPLGLIDWQTYVIFVPIALFSGLITQFIFEEKTVTTSVWSPEVE